MSTVSDILYALRDEASRAAESLKIKIVHMVDATTAAQEVLDKLEAIANSSEDAAQLVASSNIEPKSHALAPIGSGFETPNTDGRPGSCARCSYVEKLHRPTGTIDHTYIEPTQEPTS